MKTLKDIIDVKGIKQGIKITRMIWANPEVVAYRKREEGKVVDLIIPYKSKVKQLIYLNLQKEFIKLFSVEPIHIGKHKWVICNSKLWEKAKQMELVEKI